VLFLDIVGSSKEVNRLAHPGARGLAWRAVADICEGEAEGDHFRVEHISSKAGGAPHRSDRGALTEIEELIPRVVIDRASIDAGRWLAESKLIERGCVR
jgi:hypothetical protein